MSRLQRGGARRLGGAAARGPRTNAALDVRLGNLGLGELAVHVRSHPDGAQRPLLGQQHGRVEHGGRREGRRRESGAARAQTSWVQKQKHKCFFYLLGPRLSSLSTQPAAATSPRPRSAAVTPPLAGADARLAAAAVPTAACCLSATVPPGRRVPALPHGIAVAPRPALTPAGCLQGSSEARSCKTPVRQCASCAPDLGCWERAIKGHRLKSRSSARDSRPASAQGALSCNQAHWRRSEAAAAPTH